MIIEEALADSIKNSGPTPWGSVDQYTLVDYDEETRLSILEKAGGMVSNIPKLEHVKLEGGWVRVDSVTYTSGDNELLVFPRSDYDLFEIHMSGHLSGGTGSVNIRMNDDSTASLHRQVHTRWDESGVVTSGSASDGTIWPLHSFLGGIHSNAQIEIWRGSANLWHMEGRDQSAAPPGGGHQTLYSGRLNSDIGDIDRMRFSVSGGPTFNEVRILIYGRTRPVEAGAQVLAMKTTRHPLVIIGLLNGSTI